MNTPTTSFIQKIKTHFKLYFFKTLKLQGALCTCVANFVINDCFCQMCLNIKIVKLNSNSSLLERKHKN